MGVGELSPRTYEIYELALRKHVLPALGARKLAAIGPDDLVGWIRKLRLAGYAPHSVHNYWGPVHLVLTYAVRCGVIGSSPADRLTSAERPKPGARRCRVLDRHELELLLNAAPERYRVAIACGLFSGLRLSELLGLTWSNIDIRGRTVQVRKQMGRNGKRRPLKTSAASRDVILMAQLGSELRRLRLASPCSGPGDLVFCTATGQTKGHRNVTGRGLEKAAAAAGLEGVTFHVLRHTFASILIAQGHDVVFVSRQLGHANAAITLKVYAHLFDAQRHADKARERLEAEYGACSGKERAQQPRGVVRPSTRGARIFGSAAAARPALRLELDLDRLVDEVATRVAAELAEQIASQAQDSSPWMAMEEAIGYTRIPAGTFRKWVAAGRIPAHGGRRKLFHRAELEAALGYVARGANGRQDRAV